MHRRLRQQTHPGKVREDFLEEVMCKLYFKANLGICKRKKGRLRASQVREKHE